MIETGISWQGTCVAPDRTVSTPFWSTVGYYIYRDANRRDRPYPLARGVGFGPFEIGGLLAYEARKRTE